MADNPRDDRGRDRDPREWDRDWDRERDRHSTIEGNSALIAILQERQLSNIRRLDELEKKQAEYDKLLNRGLGAIGLIAALGVFLSWLFSVGGNLAEMFHR